jgi:hypothetical protein
MDDRTPWLKRVGALWLVVGGVCLIWAVLTLAGGLASGFTSTWRSVLTPAVLSDTLLWPWTQLVVAFIGLFVLYCGWGLVRRQRWTQTLMVPGNLLFAVYALAAWVAAFVSTGHLYEGWAGKSLALLAAFAVSLYLAAWMNSVSTSEALSWLPLRTAPLVPLQCEFCGTPLDPTDGRCPQCQSELELGPKVPPKPPDAKLVGTSDEREFYLTPDRAVAIGRGSTRNEINLANPTVSRRHAQIFFEKGCYLLKAVDDRNGTFVNNVRVRQQALNDGDEIRFGRASYRFRIVE